MAFWNNLSTSNINFNLSIKEEGRMRRTRLRLRLKLFSTFFIIVTLGDIFNSRSQLTVHSLGALEHNSLINNNQEFLHTIVNIPGFGRNKRVNEMEVMEALTESNLSQEQPEEDEEDSITISRPIDPQLLQRLESKFLKLFGMQERPNKFNKKIKIPKYLLDLYKRQNGDGVAIPTSNLLLPGRNTRTANTIRTFYTNEESPLSQNHLIFDISSIPENEEVTGAEIRVPFTFHKDQSIDDSMLDEKHVKILIHDIIKLPTPPKSKKPKEHHLLEPITQPMDSKKVNILKRRNGTSTIYLTFDVFPAIQRWLKGQGKVNKNNGLLLEILGVQDHVPTGHKLRVKRSLKEAAVIETSTQNESSNGHHPIMLFTYSDDGHNGRKTRDAKTLSRQYRAAQNQRRRKGQRNKNRRRNLCSRHNMFVDFTDVGWNDWIVAPPGYQAFHCAGECPFPMADHLNATNHAVIQALVNSMNPGLVPPPCCVPTKYSALSLLYTDSSDKIVLKNYNEMVVDSCGCS